MNEKFPKENRKEIKRLEIYQKNLEDPLDLTSFPKLSFLNADYNHITEIILFKGIIEILLSKNRLKDVKFLEDMEEKEKNKNLESKNEAFEWNFNIQK